MKKIALILLFLSFTVNAFATDYWVYIKKANEIRSSMAGRSQRGDVVDAIPCANSNGIPQTPGYLIVKMDLTDSQRAEMLQPYTVQKLDIKTGELVSTSKAYRKNKINLDRFYDLPGSRTLTPRLIQKTLKTLNTYKKLESKARVKDYFVRFSRRILNAITPKAIALSARQRYVNTASAGGDGTTNAESGATAAYASLNIAEDTEDNDGDLVTNDVYLVISCSTGSGTAADTTSVTVDGFTPDSTRYIKIEGDNDTGKASTSLYRLSPATNGHALQILNGYITVKYVEITGWHMAAYSQGFGIGLFGGSNYSTIDSCIIHDPADFNRPAGIYINDYNPPGITIKNNVIYNIYGEDGTYLDGISIFSNYIGYYIYNNTIYNCERYGINSGGDLTSAINNVATGCGTAFNGTFNVNSDYNASDDISSPGANSIDNIVIADNFTDYANGDFSVKDTSADIYNSGTTIASVTDDIIGTSRPQSTAYDMSAFEYLAVVTATQKIISVNIW